MPLDPKTSALITLACDIAQDATTFNADMVAAISVGVTEQELLDLVEVARGLGVESSILDHSDANIRHHFRRVD